MENIVKSEETIISEIILSDIAKDAEFINMVSCGMIRLCSDNEAVCIVFDAVAGETKNTIYLIDSYDDWMKENALKNQWFETVKSHFSSINKLLSDFLNISGDNIVYDLIVRRMISRVECAVEGINVLE